MKVARDWMHSSLDVDCQSQRCDGSIGYGGSPDETRGDHSGCHDKNEWVVMLHFNSISFCVSNRFCTRLQLNNL